MSAFDSGQGSLSSAEGAYRNASGEGLDATASTRSADDDDEYVRIDWSHSARAIHNQVRAWQLTFGMSGLRAPLAMIGGSEVVVLETRLTDPGGDATSVDCGDGRLWVVATEPA